MYEKYRKKDFAINYQKKLNIDLKIILFDH